jgi:hypothetical protein
MAKQQMAREEKSLGDLFTDLAAHTGKLVRQEVALAQTELTNKASALSHFFSGTRRRDPEGPQYDTPSRKPIARGPASRGSQAQKI